MAEGSIFSGSCFLPFFSLFWPLSRFLTLPPALGCMWLFLKKTIFIYSFLEREEGREEERESNINVWLPLTCPLLGTWRVTETWTLTRNWTSDPWLYSLVLNPLSHTSQGCMWLFKANFLHPTFIWPQIPCPPLGLRAPWLGRGQWHVLLCHVIHVVGEGGKSQPQVYTWWQAACAGHCTYTSALVWEWGHRGGIPQLGKSRTGSPQASVMYANLCCLSSKAFQATRIATVH